MKAAHPSWQRLAAGSAWLNVLIGLANLAIVFGVLGPTLLADQTQVVALIVRNPTPLYLLELLKGLSALVTIGLVWGLQPNLRATRAMRWPWLNLLFGGLSAALIAASGFVGASAIIVAGAAGQAGAAGGTAETYNAITRLVNGLGVASLACNGLWVLRVSWQTLRAGIWPRGLCYLGFGLGGLSLLAWVVPPLALLVLLASLVWSGWLGSKLLQTA